MEMTEYAVQSTSDDHADTAKPTSIWTYGQLSGRQSMDYRLHVLHRYQKHLDLRLLDWSWNPSN